MAQAVLFDSSAKSNKSPEHAWLSDCSPKGMGAAGAALNRGFEFARDVTSDGDPRKHKGLRSLLAVSAGAITVAAFTYFAYQLKLNVASTGFLYLLVVVFLAMVSGFWEATVVSIAAVTCLNYFFVPPVFTFVVADPQNWVALGAFELTALVVSRLSTSVKRQAEAEARHRLLVERLYELSRRILLLDRRNPAGPGIEGLVQEIFHVRATVRPPGSAFSETLPTRLLGSPLDPIAELVFSSGNLDAPTADAIASLAAIALERARSFDAESRAEAARQSEELRAAVLDALGHAFKTPLTVIRAASSGLLDAGRLAGSDAEMLTLIDQESERLSQLTSRLLQAARIDRAQVHPLRLSIATLVEEVLAGYREQLRGRKLQISIEPPDLTVDADRELLSIGVGQLVDNAAKYSPAGSPVEVSAARQGNEIVISVHNEGPPISAADHERIFERFYRAEESKLRAPGTGLGLSIAKQTAEAHGGRLWVTSEEDKGTTFFFAIPREGRKLQ